MEDCVIKRLFKKYHIIITYALVGCGTVPINWGVYTLVMLLLKNAGTGDLADIIIANTASWLLSSIFAYFFNKKYVFRSNYWEIKHVLLEMSMFFGIRAASTVLELVLQPILTKRTFLGAEWFGVRGLPAKIVITVVVIIVNYVFSKLFIFGSFVKSEK